MIWHSHSAEDVLLELNTDRHTGLAEETARQRLKEYGENALKTSKKKRYPSALVNLHKLLSVALLTIVAVSVALSFYNHLVHDEVFQWQQATAILLILLLTALPNVLRQRRDRAILSSYKKKIAPCQNVRREGRIASVPVYALVPGDIIELQAGDVAPADCRLLESAGVKCDESTLTGAVAPTDKEADTTFADITPLTERTNMLYAGCGIISGQAVAVVVATGKQSEMGHLAVLSDKNENSSTPLHKTAIALVRFMSIPALVILATVSSVYLFLYGKALDAFTLALALAVSVIPAGLSAIVPAVWTSFVRNKTAGNAVIKRLPAMETLGNITTLCVDTDHVAADYRTELRRAFVSHRIVELCGEPPTKGLLQLLRLAALSTHMDDPDEEAILAYIRRVDTNRDLLLMDMPRVNEIPFGPFHKRSTVVHQIDEKAIVIVKGAPQAIFPCCSRGHTDEAIAAATALEKSTGRVTAVAYKILDSLPTDIEADSLERDLSLAGLLSTADTPQAVTDTAVCACEKAVIRTVLFTQDASQRLGIVPEGALSITGQELEGLSDAELRDCVGRYRVFSRATAEDKCRIVAAFREQGEVVAVTAADTADIPLVQAANIGCAMGRDSSTTVTEVTDAIVTDNTFATLVRAILDSRRAVDGVRRSAQYLLSSCLASLVTFLVLLFIGNAPSPLLPLWISFVTGSLLLLTLVKEKPSVSHVTPRHRVGVLTPYKGAGIFLQGAITAAAALLAYSLGRDGWSNGEVGLSMAYVTLGLGLVTHAVSNHTPRYLLKAGFRDNRRIVSAALAAVVLLLAALVIPGLREIFALTAIEPTALIAAIGLGLATLPIAELCKYLIQK